MQANYKQIGNNVKKLLPNLVNKTNYVVHYGKLQLHLSLGIKPTKIHKILKFSNLID